jgi:TM2 domain-containing membrane protein YozV
MCSYEAKDRQKFCPGCGSPFADLPPTGYTPPSSDYPPPSPVYSPPESGYSDTNSGSARSTAYDPNAVTPDKLVLQPAVAVLLSVLILCGLGQMINGQIGKGLLLLGLQVLLGLITCGISAIPGQIFVGIDAYMCAKALQEGKTIGKWSFFGAQK